MPGFRINPDQQEQVAPPKNVVYTYTWELSMLRGARANITSLIYAKSLTPPTFTIDSEKVDTGHAQYEFAKSIKWQDVKIIFYDTEGLGAELNTLSKAAWSKERGIGVANDYMGESEIIAYYYDGTKAYDWKLYNSWIKSVSFGELTYESTGIQSVTVTLGYTWAIFTA